MARINIEESFWLDVMHLVAKLGDQDKAIGMALRFIRLAQQKHKKGLAITEAEFQENRFDTALIGVFAEAKPSGIEAKGSEKHFAWLEQKIEAGKRGGLAKSESKIKHLKQNRPKRTEAKPSDTEPSYSSSYSLSFLSLNTPNASHLGEIVETTPPEVSNPVGYFIGSYRKAFRARYPEANPDVRGKVQGQIKTLLKDYPLQKAIELIQVYCQMNGPNNRFKNNGHDFNTFMLNLNPIMIAMSQGAEGNRQKTIAEILADEENENATARV